MTTATRPNRTTSRLPIRFLGTGSYLPERVVTNKFFVDYLDTSEEWIISRTGIRERRYAAPEETTSTLAVHAARAALTDAGLTIEDVDVIVCATATGDCQFPATATFAQGELGAKNTPAFDVGAACAGFIHAMIVGAGLLNCGVYKRALVIGAEALTRFADMEDRTTCVLFGDAAGAAVLEPADDPDHSIIYHEIGCEGTRANHIWMPAGGARLPASETTVAERLHFLRMRGREVYKFAVMKMHELIDRALSESGLKAEDLTLIIPHQSNLRIIDSARVRLGLPPEKVAVHIDRYGNTSAASVIVALDEARKNGTVREGDFVLLIGIGAGLVWGVAIVQI